MNDQDNRNVDPNTRAAKDVGPETEAMNVSIGGKQVNEEKDGIVTRGNGCAIKGLRARGPMA